MKTPILFGAHVLALSLSDCLSFCPFFSISLLCSLFCLCLSCSLVLSLFLSLPGRSLYNSHSIFCKCSCPRLRYFQNIIIWTSLKFLVLSFKIIHPHPHPRPPHPSPHIHMHTHVHVDTHTWVCIFVHPHIHILAPPRDSSLGFISKTGCFRSSQHSHTHKRVSFFSSLGKRISKL